MKRREFVLVQNHRVPQEGKGHIANFNNHKHIPLFEGFLFRRGNRDSLYPFDLERDGLELAAESETWVYLAKKTND